MNWQDAPDCLGREPIPEEFRFKPFAEMSEADYATAGFRSGLEIHQQVLTAKKLFCRCPAGRYSDIFHAEILRHMRPTLSELGEYDGTALMEFKTRKDVIYHINRETVCTYEMDDTPPFEMDAEALDIALAIAMLYGCMTVDEIHIARKQYLDGSIPTGFQRTCIVGVDGKIPFKGRDIPIVQLGLEEDACREVSDVGHRRTYLTDRLGMPLIETVTAPEMRTPQEVAEVGEILRRLVRSTGRVRTGIGAARQDVNVSVSGGTRIEIKGVPRIPRIPLLTYNEAMRQWNLLRLRAELRRRGIDPGTFTSRTEDVTKYLRKTRYTPVFEAVAAGKVVKAVALTGFSGVMRWTTQTDTHFSREISDRVRVIACLTTLPNILHSDHQGESLSTAEWQSVKKAVAAGTDDTVVLVWGDAADAESGAREVVIRAKEATVGVPSETRQALRDGTNGFERILPGPDRMYPDTDLPPRKITAERLDRLRATLPDRYWEREAWYGELGIPQDTVGPLAISRLAPFFERLVKEGGATPTLAAVVLVQQMKRLRRERVEVDAICEADLAKVFSAHREGRLAREGILGVLRRLAMEGPITLESLPHAAEPATVETSIREGLLAATRAGLEDPVKRFNAAMGVAMDSVRGRVPGTAVAARVREGLCK
jgi:glutamyl-tRNA(Gln) amidotransferase subunit E